MRRPLRPVPIAAVSRTYSVDSNLQLRSSRVMKWQQIRKPTDRRSLSRRFPATTKTRATITWHRQLPIVWVPANQPAAFASLETSAHLATAASVSQGQAEGDQRLHASNDTSTQPDHPRSESETRYLRWLCQSWAPARFPNEGIANRWAGTPSSGRDRRKRLEHG